MYSELKNLNSGVDIKITIKTKKSHKCSMCGGLIEKNSMCISAYGFDYDNQRLNEKIHPDPKCYDQWIDNFDIITKSDIDKMIRKASSGVKIEQKIS